MKWDIQTVGFNADDKLVEYAKEKTLSLGRFFENIVGAEVYLKLDYNDKQENKVVEIKLNIPGNDLYADSRSDVFEGAVNQACEKLKAQISKLKTKLSTH